jgi:predicted GNAT family acetyltransferase
MIITHNFVASRFETTIAGDVARVEYRMSGHRMIITHTEVPELLRGKGIAKLLVAFVMKYALRNRIEIDAECEFAKWFISRDSTMSATAEQYDKPDSADS